LASEAAFPSWLPKYVIEKMRKSYAKAAEKYLQALRKEEAGKGEALARMNRQFLVMAGYSAKEIEALGDLSQKTEDEIQQLMKKRQMAALGLNGNSTQKVVPFNEVKVWITEGWEYVKDLNGSEAIIRLPGH
jgi:hypothetical protein